MHPCITAMTFTISEMKWVQVNNAWCVCVCAGYGRVVVVFVVCILVVVVCVWVRVCALCDWCVCVGGVMGVW